MKYPVVVSSIEDIAGTNIKAKLIEQGDWAPVEQDSGAKEILFHEKYQAYLVIIEEPLVQSDNLDEYCARAGINPLAYIFASRHRSETAKPALLAHVTGNWGGQADLGGEPYHVCHASGALLRLAYRELLRQKDIHPDELAKFVVDLEVTHHGPTNLQAPLVFVELGSDETNWRDGAGASAVADVIKELLGAIAVAGYDLGRLGQNLAGVGIGFGGLHYAQSFERVMAESTAALTHIVPKHAIDMLTRDIIELAVTNTIEPVSWFVLDWKGLNAEQKDVLLPILESFSIPIKRTKDLERDYSTSKSLPSQ
ncbi:MAG TPA: D-aminoacyl-tRNA deacylase [Candidatus Lokiarchaeia archaeon]|nr:D-aminoacyl-tRNA deacylase [Candidatus Lokiarchaeia archaeon]